MTGDRNAGKTGEVYGRARDAAKSGARVAILVPSLPERDRAASEFGQGFPTRIAVETLDAFLGQLWEQWGDGRRILGEPERLILLDEAAERSRTLWDGRVPSTALRRVLPVLVQRAAERDPDKALRRPQEPLAAALVAAVEAYERLAEEQGLIEPAAAHRRAAAAIPSGGLPDLVCLNRFETFTPPQAAFLEAASRKTDVIVALTYVPGSMTTAAVEGLARRLEALASATVRVASEPVDTVPEIAALQKGLSSGEATAVSTGAVAFIGVRGASEEAAAAARAIAEMVDSGISPDRVGLVARRIDRRSVAVGEALDAHGLPWRYEGTWRFRDSGFGRSAMALLRLVRDGRREDLAAFLQGGYAGLTAEEADGFLKAVRGRRPAHGDELWRLASRAPGAAGRILAAAEALRRGAVGAGAVDALRCLADEMLVHRHGTAPVLEREGRLDARCRQRMLEAAGAVVRSRGCVDVDALVRALDRTSVTVEDDSAGVVVSSPERIRSRRFDGLVLLGLQAEEFPSASGALGLPRKLVDALDEAGIDARPRTDLDAERLLFYQAVTAARRRLALVWQDADDDGRDRERSLFVDELMDAYRVAPEVQKGEGAGQPPSPPKMGEEARTAGARKPSAVRSAWEDAELGADLREALAQRSVFAASELEAYLRCPRLWFYRYVVRAEGLDAEIDALRAGRVAHAILQRFYEKWQELATARVHPADLARALELHAHVAESVAADGMTAESLRERARIQRAVRGSRLVIVRDAESFVGFEPVRHEVVLSDEEPWTEFDGWRLRGRVDRVDAGEAGLIVTDYKSRTKPELSWRRFESGGVLQAPLYAAVIRRMLGQPVAGVVYRTMSWREKDRGAYLRGAVMSPWLAAGDAVDADGLEAIIADAVRRAGEAVAGIRAGRIPCEPLGKDTCESCPADTWCGRAAR